MTDVSIGPGEKGRQLWDVKWSKFLDYMEESHREPDATEQ